MVTSFNEWYEDTQIEATLGTAQPTTRDDSASGVFYTAGDSYADYGYLYLDILREELLLGKAQKRGTARIHPELLDPR